MHLLADEHLVKEHWQPMFVVSKPVVSVRICCSHVELPRSKLHKTGDHRFGNWHVIANILVAFKIKVSIIKNMQVIKI